MKIAWRVGARQAWLRFPARDLEAMQKDSLRAYNCRAHESAVSAYQHDNGKMDNEDADSYKRHSCDSTDAYIKNRTIHTDRSEKSSERKSPNGSDRTHAHPDDEGVERLEKDGIILADGGITWTDLTGFQRDLLETIAYLETSEEVSYGLEIKRYLEIHYDEVNNGRLYQNLNCLIDRHLLKKIRLDHRTNEYRLTENGQTLLENRARTLARTCGFDIRQPATDGGSH